MTNSGRPAFTERWPRSESPPCRRPPTDSRQATAHGRPPGSLDLPHQCRRLLVAVDIGAHGDRRQALRCQITPSRSRTPASPPATAVRCGRSRWESPARQHGQLEPFTLGAAQEDLDQLVVFTELADTVADEGSPQEAGQLRGAHAQRTGAILIDVQAHHLAWLLPVQMDVGHVRVLADLGGDLPRQPAHHIDVLAGDTELHRVTHRRGCPAASRGRAGSGSPRACARSASCAMPRGTRCCRPAQRTGRRSPAAADPAADRNAASRCRHRPRSCRCRPAPEHLLQPRHLRCRLQRASAA